MKSPRILIGVILVLAIVLTAWISISRLPHGNDSLAIDSSAGVTKTPENSATRNWSPPSAPAQQAQQPSAAPPLQAANPPQATLLPSPSHAPSMQFSSHDPSVPSVVATPVQPAKGAAGNILPTCTAELMGRWKNAKVLDSLALQTTTGLVETVLFQPADLPYTVRIQSLTPASDSIPAHVETSVGNRLIFRPAKGSEPAAVESAIAELGVRIERRFSGSGAYLVAWDDPKLDDLPAKLSALQRKSGLIEYAEPDSIIFSNATPNDPKYLDGSLWGLHNTGQTGSLAPTTGTADADIDAPEAWDIRRDAPGVIVAVVDTGISLTHQDLVPNLWTNSGESGGGKETNGIDDDGNGYIDDVHGINGINGTGNPADDQGHGSHCAGTIGARGDDNAGVVGVAWNVKLMGTKFLSSEGSGALSDAITCLDYAREMGAHILSNSWGGGPYSTTLHDTIKASRNAGQIFVVAAGNESTDNDIVPMYPANYQADNVVSVAATTRTDGLAYFSCYGQGYVQVAAPGHEILSCKYDDDTGYIAHSGTSMATPHVSGMFALLKAHFPTESPHQLINRLIRSYDAKSGLAGKVQTGGRVNLLKALTSTSYAPFNDNFADAHAITGSAAHVRSRNHYASAESGEPVHAGIASTTNSVWFKWTAGASGTTLINTVESTFDTVLAVYTGADLASLTQVVANDDDASATTSRVSFEAVKGSVYYIAVAGKLSAEGLVALTLSGPPSDDALANATLIEGFPTSGSGTNVNASKEPGEANHAGHAGGHSVWLKWIPNFSGGVIVSTAGSSIDTLLAVYSGPASNPTHGALTPVAQNDDYSAVGLTTSLLRFNAVSGTTYYIATDGKNGAEGNLQISLYNAIANDNFADRIPLTNSTHTLTTEDNRYATREVGEPDHASAGGKTSFWWSWTAPSTGTWQMDTAGSLGESCLAVYTGSALGSLTEVASGSYNYTNSKARVLLRATAGTTYQIAVDSPPAWYTGRLQLNIAPVSTPANDNFADAITLTGTPTLASPVTAAGHNAGADFETGEPEADGYPNSVWWKWTATTTARYSLSTAGSDFDTVLHVCTGSALGALTVVAQNDDGGTNRTSFTSFDATAGTTYYFRVTGYSQLSGSIQLSLLVWQPVANDSFSSPVELTGTAYRLIGTNNETTAEPGEPAHGTIGGDNAPAVHSIWYRYTATNNSKLTFSCEGSNPDTRVGVYTGTAVNALTLVAQNDDYVDPAVYNALGTFAGQVTWQGVPGTTYYIAVDSDHSTLTGAIVATFVVGPANDDFANATNLGSVSSYNETTYNHGASRETGESTKHGFNQFFARSLWWSWTAPSTAQYEISTEGSSLTYEPGTFDLNTGLVVYTGSAVTALTSVASNDNIDTIRNALTSRVVLNATAGTTYRIMVAVLDASNNANPDIADVGEVKLSLKPFQAAAHNTLANAITIAPGGTIESTNLGASIQTAEPGTANSASDPNYDSARSKGTLWYKWTATKTARYHAAVTGFYLIGRAEKTILSVYSGPASNPSFSPLNLTLLAWDKDSGGNSYSQTSFDATAGTTYYFQVGSESRGKFTFLLNETPANDNFSEATIMTGSSWTSAGTTVGATFETGEPTLESPSTNPRYDSGKAKSVWWRWTAPASGSAAIDSLNSTIYSGIGIYTGSQVNSLTFVQKATGIDPYNGEQPRRGNAQLSFPVTAGVTYYIQVEGLFPEAGSAGLVNLALVFTNTPVTPPFVSVFATPKTGSEGGVGPKFVLTRTGDATASLTVNLAYTGTATNGVDYESLPTAVTFAAGQASVTLPVVVYNDSLLESLSPETVIATVQTGTGYQPGGSSSASAEITDPASFAATGPVLSSPRIGANTLGLAWTFPASDHTQWRLQTASAAPAALVLYEGFAYSAGNLVGNGTWAEKTTGTALTVADGNLSYAGVSEPTGRSVAIPAASSAQSALRPFTTAGTVTDVYYSFLLRVTNLASLSSSAWGTLTRAEDATATPVNGLGLFIRKNSGGSTFDLGIHKRANGSAVATDTPLQNLSTGTTYLIVARYRTVSGTGNDPMDLWINPGSLGGVSEPTPTYSAIAGTDTAVDWVRFILAPAANLGATFDELRIGTSWASVTYNTWNTGNLLDAADSGAILTGLTANTTYSYRLRAENGGSVSAWSNTLNATTAATATPADWLVTHFNTAFAEGSAAWTADPDGDGTANIIEYALGSTPTSAASRLLPTVSTSTDHLTLSFTPARVTGLRYIVEASSNLAGWTAIDVTASLTAGQLYTHTDTANLSTSPRRFLRLRIELAP